ncbi:MAG: zinc-binding alcohol dehydrogenase family protein [Alphaproteobacteria bacterium]|nr:zinc-binding alcohol dehydrogenase family protein [Alphaproteobacteria bacterium]
MMKAVIANAASTDLATLDIAIAEQPVPEIGPDQCLVEVLGASINASDVKGLLGTMPRLVWPRTPGRDYAGKVADGPAGTKDREVWGSGADLGMSRNGAHAQYLVVEATSLHDKPKNLSMLEAAGIGVPFCTAQIGLVDYAKCEAGETVAVMGLNGKVGQAVTQIATALGAKVIGVERTRDDYAGHTNGPVEVINAANEDIVEAIMEKTEGKGADIVFNTVGEPYLGLGNSSLRPRGRQVVINALDKHATLDLSQFYRKRLQLLGMASMGFDAVALGEVLERLKPGFESGALKPYKVEADAVFTLDAAADGYRKAASDDTRARIYIDPTV